MADNTYSVIEIVGVSEDTISTAVLNALKKAAQTMRHIDWFKVTKVRGAVQNGSDPVFQVTITLGFRLEG